MLGQESNFTIFPKGPWTDQRPKITKAHTEPRFRASEAHAAKATGAHVSQASETHVSDTTEAHVSEASEAHVSEASKASTSETLEFGNRGFEII